MKLSKGKIILIVIVIYFIIFGIINVNKEKNYNKDILNKVVYVTDGKVKKENNNKLVIVTGKISYDNLVSFLELDESFSTIKATRKVEDYLKTKDGYEWTERLEPLKDSNGDYFKQIVSAERISEIKVGEFVLDDKGKDLVPADKTYNKQEKVGEFITKGIDYSRDPYEEDLKEGDIRLTYKYYDLEKYPYMSILAVQKDNSFIPYKVDKKTSIYQIFKGKIDTKTKLEKELKNNEKRTIKGKTLFILIIIGVGIFLIVDNKKKK